MDARRRGPGSQDEDSILVSERGETARGRQRLGHANANAGSSTCTPGLATSPRTEMLSVGGFDSSTATVTLGLRMTLLRPASRSPASLTGVLPTASTSFRNGSEMRPSLRTRTLADMLLLLPDLDAQHVSDR